MILSPEERLLLDLATEDFYNIWDGAYQLRKIHAGDSFEVLRKKATEAMLALNSKGFLELFERKFGDLEHVKVDSAKIQAVLARDEIWDSEKMNTIGYEIEFSSTPAGDEAFRTKLS